MNGIYSPAHGLPELIVVHGVTMVHSHLDAVPRTIPPRSAYHPIGKVKTYDNFHYLHFLREKWRGNCAGMWDKDHIIYSISKLVLLESMG